MRDICDEAQVSCGAIYRYFKSKSEFIDAASAEYAARLRDLIGQVTVTAQDAKEGLHLIGEHYYGLFHEPGFFEMARADAELHAQTLRNPELRRVGMTMLATMRDAFSTMMEKVPEPPGHEGRATAKTVANLVMALWFGLQYTKALDPDNVDTDAVFSLLESLLSPAAEQGQ
jgi:AcrR family transcriptional regulator